MISSNEKKPNAQGLAANEQTADNNDNDILQNEKSQQKPDPEEQEKVSAANDMPKNGFLWPPMPDDRYISGNLQKYGSRTHGCQITIYPEQVPCIEDEITAYMQLGIPDREHAIMEILANRIRKVPRDDFFITAMVHDDDVKVSEGSFYTSKIEKIHMHINVLPGQNQQKKRKFYLSTILDAIKIQFRFPEDDWLILRGHIQSIRDPQQAVLYLMHDTAQSRHEGKTPYEFDAMISNYSSDEVMDFIRGAALMNGRHKATIEDWENLGETAKIAGRDDFRKSPVRELQSVLDEFVDRYTGIFTDFRDKGPKWKQAIEEYKRSWRMTKEQWENDRRQDEGNKIERVAVFIEGPPNAGKTTTAFLAIKRLLEDRYPKCSQTDIERMIANVEDSSTGNLDGVDIYTEGIIFNDSGSHEASLLSLASQKPVNVHRRYRNKMFCGDYLILTSNYGFHDYVRYFWNGSEKEIAAISTRVFRCHTESNHQLVLDASSSFCRGNDADADSIRRKFDAFMSMYNKISAGYWGKEEGTRDDFKSTQQKEYEQLKCEVQMLKDILENRHYDDIQVQRILNHNIEIIPKFLKAQDKNFRWEEEICDLIDTIDDKEVRKKLKRISVLYDRIFLKYDELRKIYASDQEMLEELESVMQEEAHDEMTSSDAGDTNDTADVDNIEENPFS